MEVDQKLTNFGAKAEDRLSQVNRDSESGKQRTNARIQTVEITLKDLRDDMNQNLLQMRQS